MKPHNLTLSGCVLQDRYDDGNARLCKNAGMASSKDIQKGVIIFGSAIGAGVITHAALGDRAGGWGLLIAIVVGFVVNLVVEDVLG